MKVTLANPKISEHGGELILLGVIAVGVLILIGMMIMAGINTKASPGVILGDVSAFLLVENSIIGAIKDRWNARLQGQSNEQLANSKPIDATEPKPTGKPGDPLHVTEEGTP